MSRVEVDLTRGRGSVTIDGVQVLCSRLSITADAGHPRATVQVTLHPDSLHVVLPDADVTASADDT